MFREAGEVRWSQFIGKPVMCGTSEFWVNDVTARVISAVLRSAASTRPDKPPPWGFLRAACWRNIWEFCLHPPLHRTQRKRAHSYFHSNEPLSILVPER